MHLCAYYNNEGAMLAIVRNIPFSSLPLALQFDLKKSYKDSWITNISEVTTQDGTQYLVTLENSNRRAQLRSNGSHDWKVIKREAKQ
jgi:hypothetical protein